MVKPKAGSYITPPKSKNPLENPSQYIKPSYFLNPPRPGTEEYRAAKARTRRATPKLLKKAAPKTDYKAAVAAEGALIEWHYGDVLTQPKIFAMGADDTSIYIGLLWGRGECGTSATIYINKEALPAAQVHHYAGTQGQGVDSWLAASISGYADTLPGLCYSVIKIPSPDWNSWPLILGRIQGLKVYDPRTLTTIYSENPALFFREAAIYGGLEIDEDSIEETADACDGTLDSKPRRAAGISFDTPLSLDEILTTLAGYAGALYVRSGNKARLIANRPRATTLGFTDDETDGTRLKILKDSLTIRKISTAALPNRVICEYQDTSTVPWSKGLAIAPASPPAGQVRTTRLIMPGIHSYAQAKREAIEALNYYNLTDLECSFTAFDDSLELVEGDNFELTHADGLTNKAFLATSIEMGAEKGHWAISGREYDPAVFSDDITTDPTFADTELPSPTDIPAGPTPALVEVLFEDEAGKTFSRFEVTFTGSSWPYVHSYRVTVYAGSTVVLETTITHQGEVAHVLATAPIKQGDMYTAEIYLVNSFGQVGDLAGTDTETAQGKLLLPTAPTGLSGFEAGQFVSLTWTKGIDLDYIGSKIKRLDKVTYEANVAGAWDSGSAIVVQSRLDAEAALLFAQPVGEYYYMVKSLDSLGQESDSASPPYGRTDKLITVTADSAGGVSVYDFPDRDETFDLEAYEYEVHGDGVYIVQSSGHSWVEMFGAAGSSWNGNFSAGHPWCKFNYAVGGFRYRTNDWDVGLDKQGNWVWSMDYTTHQGTVTQETKLAKSADWPTYTSFAGASVNAEARYMEAVLKNTGNTGDCVTLKMHPVASYQGRILEDVQTISVPASPQPKAVIWGQPFASQPRVSLALQGSLPRIIAFDSPTQTGCNLYAWNGSTPAAATIVVTAIGT